MSQLGGSQHGTYMIHPRQMATKKPANANDEDLFDGMSNIDKPLDQPTIMSYFLQRIRLGEICREISDQCLLSERDLGHPDYEQVKEIDKLICDFCQTLPPFLHLNFDASEIPEPDSRRSPGVLVHRYVINSMLHTQRCRLHLPYLSRKQDASYSYSRDACLEAARMVIRAEAQLSSEDIPFVMTRLKFSGSLLCVCMAIIALLTDYCHNKSSYSNEDRERRSEIQKALQILEERKNQSSFVGKLLDSFNSILRRNKVRLPAEASSCRLGDLDKSKLHSSMDPTTMPATFDTAETEAALAEPVLPTFNNFWETFDTSMDPSTLFDWSTLLSELDAPFLSM